MSNALEQAKRAQEESARGTKVVIPLALLESLIAEIDRLRDLQSGNRPGVNVVSFKEPV